MIDKVNDQKDKMGAVMKKDDIVKVTIEDMSSEGLGVGRSDGLALFIKDTVIGDVAEVKVMKMKKTYGYARLMRLLLPSPDRVDAPCPVAKQCGGCQIQAMDYEAQLRFKENKVRGNLQRIGKFQEIPMEKIIGMDTPFRYRNKAQFPIGTDKNGKLIAGFYAGRTHSIIECKDCLLGNEINQKILEIVLKHMESHKISAYDEKTGKDLLCADAADGGVSFCAVRMRGEISDFTGKDSCAAVFRRQRRHGTESAVYVAASEGDDGNGQWILPGNGGKRVPGGVSQSSGVPGRDRRGQRRKPGRGDCHCAGRRRLERGRRSLCGQHIGAGAGVAVGAEHRHAECGGICAFRHDSFRGGPGDFDADQVFCGLCTSASGHRVLDHGEFGGRNGGKTMGCAARNGVWNGGSDAPAETDCHVGSGG